MSGLEDSKNRRKPNYIADNPGMTLLRALVAIVVIYGSILVAGNARLWAMSYYIALAIPAAAVVFLMVRHPIYGYIGLLLASAFVGATIGTGTGSSINATMIMTALILGFWIIDMMVRQRRIELIRARPLLVLLLFTLTAVIAFVVGQLPWFETAAAPIASQLGGLGLFILSAGLTVATAHQLPRATMLRGLTWLFVIIGSLYVLSRVFFNFGGQLLTANVFQYRFPGSTFWVWLVAMTGGQALYNKELNPLLRIVLGLLVVANIYVLLVQNHTWASGWLPALVITASLFLLLRPRFAIFLAVCGVIIFVARAEFFLNTLVEYSNDSYSYLTRVEAWQIITEITAANPVVGLGPANYYWYTPLYDILGYNVQFNSHSQYFDLLAQTGVLGLSFYFWFFGEMFWLAWRFSRRATGFSYAFSMSILAGIIGTIVSGGLADWIIPFVYNLGFSTFPTSYLAWFFMGGMLALFYVIEPETAPDEELAETGAVPAGPLTAAQPQ